jgi:hypothetical protein
MIFYLKKPILLLPLTYLLVVEVFNFFRYDGMNSNIGLTNLKIMVILLLMVVVLFCSLLDNLKNRLDKEPTENKPRERKSKRLPAIEACDLPPLCETEPSRKSTRVRKQNWNLANELKGKVKSLFKLSNVPINLLIDDEMLTNTS